MAVAKHLHVDIEDGSTDHAVRLSSSEADESLQQRAARDPFRRETVSRPPGAGSQVSRDAGHIRIVIPRPRLHPILLAAGLIPLAIPLFIGLPLAEFFRGIQTPDPVAWAFLGFITFFFGVVPAMTVMNGFLRSRRGATIVLVSPQGIGIQERGAWRTSAVASLDASDILDVDFSTRESITASARRAADQKALESHGSAAVGPRTERLLASLARFAKGRGVTVKTRQGLTTFGEGLEDDEIRYLCALVREGLGGVKAMG